MSGKIDTVRLEALLQRAHDGDKDAEQELFTAFAPVFLRVVRSSLANRVRTVMDSTDVLQYARMLLFEKNLTDGCRSVGSFLALMTKVVERQTLQANRENLDAARRDLRREVHVDRLGLNEPNDHELGSLQMM